MSLPVWAVLLAAGESARMGRLKALLPWPVACPDPAHPGPGGASPAAELRPGQTTLFEYHLAELSGAPLDRIVVVLGHQAERLAPLVTGRARVVVNPAYATGKCSSIIAGVRAVPRGAHVLVLAVDQPRPRGVLARLIASHVAGDHEITVATHAGRRGHPVAFAPALRPDLLAITEETEGLRAVLRRHASAVSTVDFDSPLVLVNLNTPQDYEAALRLLR